ncbi:MAG: glutaredoxin family protein [Marmoricola sp.]
MRVVVYSREGCHLCHDVLDVVRRVCGDEFRLIDITTDPELEARYRTRIPVTAVDGVELSDWFLSEEQLRVALG